MRSSKEGPGGQATGGGVSLLGPSRQTSTGQMGLACGGGAVGEEVGGGGR